MRYRVKRKHASKLHVRQKKILNCFSGHCFEKQMRHGGFLFLIFIQQKTDAGTFFSKLERYFF